MQTKQNTQFGVIKFLPYAVFHNPNRDDVNARDARLAEIYEGEPTLKSVRDWPQMDDEPIYRDGTLVVETARTTTNRFGATLRFCPERPSAGGYEIRGPHGKLERGVTLRIYTVSDDERDLLVCKLTQFKTRYVVVTEADDQTRKGMVWLVGFNSLRRVDDANEAAQPADEWSP